MGSSVVNALSSWLEVEITRDGVVSIANVLKWWSPCNRA